MNEKKLKKETFVEKKKEIQAYPGSTGVEGGGASQKYCLCIEYVEKWLSAAYWIWHAKSS